MSWPRFWREIGWRHQRVSTFRQARRDTGRAAADPRFFPEPVAFRTDGIAGMPCSDCCHARFGPVPPGAPELTVNWPCSACGALVGETGGYHHRETCGTDPDAP